MIFMGNNLLISIILLTFAPAFQPIAFLSDGKRHTGRSAVR